MGATLWVDVHDRDKGALPTDQTLMLRLEKQLDRLAAKLNVTKLSEFYDYSEMESAALDEFGDGEEEAEDLPENGADQHNGKWFDPGPALAAVRAIHARLIASPADLEFRPDASRAHWPADLMLELAHCVSVLEGAIGRGQQFRFLIVP